MFYCFPWADVLCFLDQEKCVCGGGGVCVGGGGGLRERGLEGGVLTVL